MKIKLNLIFLSIFVYVSLMTQPLYVFAELIKPTRTLDSSEKTSEIVSVFSEPTDLDVYLDDSKIGKTPVISKEVTSGVHILRVKNTEREITILSGKSLKLILFKDSLIEIPDKRAKAPAQPKLEKKWRPKKRNLMSQSGKRQRTS